MLYTFEIVVVYRLRRVLGHLCCTPPVSILYVSQQACCRANRYLKGRYKGTKLFCVQHPLFFFKLKAHSIPSNLRFSARSFILITVLSLFSVHVSFISTTPSAMNCIQLSNMYYNALFLVVGYIDDFCERLYWITLAAFWLPANYPTACHVWERREHDTAVHVWKKWWWSWSGHSV